MGQFIETGHYKNVTALLEVREKALSFGAAYNPGKANIKITALDILYNAAKTDHQAVISSNIAFNNAVNDRVNLFAPLKIYATQIVAAFKSSSDADAEKIKDLISINKKIQGVRAKAKDLAPVDPNAPTPPNISASQQSFDMKVDHFTKLVELIATESTYLPNEPTLKLSGLQTHLANLEAANTLVITTHQQVTAARIVRDKTLYGSPNGVYYIQAQVKDYVKSIFNSKSIQYKQMVAIKFKIPPNLFI